jgi:hypothetical protein
MSTANPNLFDIQHGLRTLQELCGSTSESKGFHEDHPQRGDFVDGERGDLAFKRAMGHYQGNLMMLIVSEATEAHDEIRTGHRANETYYPTQELSDYDYDQPEHHKPEGVPSEVADIVIRAFDYAYRNKFSLADIIIEKITYNQTRERMHGGKAF